MDDDKLLKTTALLHENLISQLQLYFNEWDHEKTLLNIACTAKFLWQCHSGTLYDPRLEDLLRRVSQEIFTSQTVEKKKGYDVTDARQKVCHIASEVYSVGGHTRTILNWIEADKKSLHSVIVTNQTTPKLRTKYSFTYLDVKQPLVKRVKILRAFLQENHYDLIVLHVHPDEVIAFVALSELDIPIIIFNHADHVFWLGASFATVVADFVESHQVITTHDRGAVSSYLPLLLGEKLVQKVKKIDKKSAKKRLKIKEQIILVSMATPYKYMPFESFDFIDYYSKILSDKRNVGLYIIGLSPEYAEEYFNKSIEIENIHLLGILEDPYEYLVAADIFIEPLSVGTGLGTLEAILCGCSPLFNYGRTATIDGDGAISLFYGTEKRLRNIEEYTEQLMKLIDDPGFRHDTLNEFQLSLSKFQEPEWNKYLEDLYHHALNFNIVSKQNPLQNKSKKLHHARFNNFQNVSLSILLNRYKDSISTDFFFNAFITAYNQYNELTIQYKYLQEYSRDQRLEVKEFRKVVREKDSNLDQQEAAIKKLKIRIAEQQEDLEMVRTESNKHRESEQNAVRIIEEYRNSISFKLGWALTAPIRVLNDLFIKRD